MAKVKKQEKSRPVVKFFIILVLAVATGFFISAKSIEFLKKSKYFRIKLITLDPSLQFVEEKELDKLKGKNIFSVDLASFQKSLNQKYPQIDQLRIIRRFPSQIQLTALKRDPMAQAQVGGNLVTVDEKGFVLAYNSKKDEQFPYIKGILPGTQKIKVGFLWDNDLLRSGLEIIKSVKANSVVSPYKLQIIDAAQPSKIVLTFAQDFTVIVDTEKINYKIRMLEAVLTQGNINFKEAKYIDLRFKEPILGTK